MKTLLTAAAIALLATGAQAGSAPTMPTASAASRLSVPVIIQAETDGDACGNGVVTGLGPRGDGFLAVKAGPGLDFKRIDKVFNGTQVYLCGRRGDWFAIVYSPTGNWTGCGVMEPWPRSLPYTGPCLSGWAHRNWIELVAG